MTVPLSWRRSPRLEATSQSWSTLRRCSCVSANFRFAPQFWPFDGSAVNPESRRSFIAAVAHAGAAEMLDSADCELSEIVIAKADFRFYKWVSR